MRSLASTILNEQGFDPDLIEAALAHIGKNEVRNAYNRAEYIERRKPLMEIVLHENEIRKEKGDFNIFRSREQKQQFIHELNKNKRKHIS